MIRPVSDPIGLEVRWDRLAAATDEAASTMLRTAFSTIIRESHDCTIVQLPGHDMSAENVPARGEEASRGVRSIHFPGHGLTEATVWNRYALTAGTELAGPAVFQEREASCSFGPDCRIRVADDLPLHRRDRPVTVLRHRGRDDPS
ncbi:hydantoinase B/oxoprolinase family protein [Streptomyces swartbergensis]|uniref:Hydantoinase B/oxoprolinase domain-containing protein n=1 Tax=Streptomyces swartbergensis TaxID=487165 RepID=A0A2C9ZNS6_9ACTN|nr:hydantoinase B/oxoprolinase family protein [Streptomyces swartbergensis]OUD05073.1 hypothetical protein CA983_00715 [Streptomyces swartbergensis]